MAIAFRDDVLSLDDDLSDEELDMEVYRSFQDRPEPGWSVLDSIAASGIAEQEVSGDELVNQEDPYLQSLLGSVEDD